MLTIRWVKPSKDIRSLLVTGKCGAALTRHTSSRDYGVGAGMDFIECVKHNKAVDLETGSGFPLPDCIECLCNFQERVYSRDYIFKKL